MGKFFTDINFADFFIHIVLYIKFEPFNTKQD